LRVQFLKEDLKEDQFLKEDLREDQFLKEDLKEVNALLRIKEPNDRLL